MGIPDINTNNMSERDIQKAVLEHHNRQLVLEVSKSKKMMLHEQDNLITKYRHTFKEKHRRKGGEQALKCGDCDGDHVQTQAHCVVCPRMIYAEVWILTR